jgi:RNA polymerase sigma-70 factor, ECF subfamily
LQDSGIQPDIISVSIDDAALAQQCRNGDSAAMERLIIKYQDRIYNVIVKICGNGHDAAELLQDTFVKVIEKVSSFEGRSGLYTWIYRIAVNLTLNHCKRRMKFAAGGLESSEKFESAKAGLHRYMADEATSDPAQIAEKNELCTLLAGALLKLSEDHRTIIVLCDIEGMNYEQIGEVLDIGPGTVKSRISRARGSLREILEAII